MVGEHFERHALLCHQLARLFVHLTIVDAEAAKNGEGLKEQRCCTSELVLHAVLVYLDSVDVRFAVGASIAPVHELHNPDHLVGTVLDRQQHKL